MHRKIGELLVERGYITESQLAEALTIQAREQERRRLGEILVARGLVKPAQIQIALANQKPQGTGINR